MKKNMEPAFDAVWWDRNQPKGMKSARALHTVLATYEKARDVAKRTGGVADVKAAEDALDKIDGAVGDVIDEAKKLAKTPPKGSDAEEFDATALVLKKYDRLYAAERAALAKMVTEDEDDDGAFSDPAEYRKYLMKGLRRVKPDDPMNFGIALGSKKTDHRMALSRSKAPMGLARMAREMTGLTMVTFGTMYEDPEDAGTLLLALEGKQLPGLKKKAERMLKQYKPLPYMRVKLLMDGEEVLDLTDPDDTDTDEEDGPASGQASPASPAGPAQPPIADPAQQRVAAQLSDRMKSVEPLVRQTILAHPDRRAELLAPVAAFTSQIASGDVAAAQRSLSDLARLLAAAAPAPGGPASPAAATPEPAYRTLVSDWTAARDTAANDLRNLETAILTEFQGQPEFPAIQAAIRRLDAILQTLSADLADKLTQAEAATHPTRGELHKAVLEQVGSYRRFVETDGLVAAVQDNPFTPVTLKPALTASLVDIEQALAA